MNTTMLGVLSAVAMLLALAFGGLYGLLVVIALIAAWWVVWSNSVAFAAYRNKRNNEREVERDAAAQQMREATQRQTRDAAAQRARMAPQRKALRAKRLQFASRMAWLVGLLILFLCWAYERDGQDGLLVALTISVMAMGVTAIFYSIHAARRRRTEVRQQQRQQGEEREVVANLTAQGLPKVMAEALLQWTCEFERKQGRAPSKEEASAWGKRWWKEHEVEIVRDYFEADGVPKPEAATDAFTGWFKAFESKYGREPSKAECANWIVRWQELHGASPLARAAPPTSLPCGLSQGSRPEIPRLPLVSTYGTDAPEETINLCTFHDRLANRKDLKKLNFEPQWGVCTFCAVGFANIQQPTLSLLQKRVDAASPDRRALEALVYQHRA